ALAYSFDLTYTYRGIRTYDRRDADVIAIDGSFRKNLDQASGGNIDGNLKATALIDVFSGQVVLFEGSYRVNRKIQLDVGNALNDQETVAVRQARGRVLGEPPGPVAGLKGAWCLVQEIDSGEAKPLFADKEKW